MRDLPPVGSTKSLEHTRHFTRLALLPKVSCSFLHFGQRILMNLLLLSLAVFIVKNLISSLRSEEILSPLIVQKSYMSKANAGFF